MSSKRSKRADVEKTFDAIIVETSGFAYPGPVAQTFFVAPFLQTKTSLDSVTTVVDAKHVLLRLADSLEAVEQIAFADQLVLNRTELVSEEALREIEAQLRRLNRLAPIHRAQRSNVALDKVLGRGGFDIERIVSLEPDLLHVSTAPPMVKRVTCTTSIASTTNMRNFPLRYTPRHPRLPSRAPARVPARL